MALSSEEQHEQASSDVIAEPLTGSGATLSAEIGDSITTHHDQRKRPYLPSCYNIYDKIKGSIYLAFLSHACFILATIFYLKLSISTLNWWMYAKRIGIPEEVLDEDTDEVWTEWASENGADNLLTRWNKYNAHNELLYILGALFFVFVGLLDLLRYFDCLNMVLVLAGIAGMMSAISKKSYSARVTWEFVSVHLFALEGYNLLHRNHDYEGVKCFRIGDICFLIGAILDCIGSYVSLLQHEALWVIQMDLVSCCLWVFSALTDVTAEVYYLRKHVNVAVNEGDATVVSYIDAIQHQVQCY